VCPVACAGGASLRRLGKFLVTALALMLRVKLVHTDGFLASGRFVLSRK
jgi:hypothetical protein